MSPLRRDPPGPVEWAFVAAFGGARDRTSPPWRGADQPPSPFGGARPPLSPSESWRSVVFNPCRTEGGSKGGSSDGRWAHRARPLGPGGAERELELVKQPGMRRSNGMRRRGPALRCSLPPRLCPVRWGTGRGAQVVRSTPRSGSPRVRVWVDLTGRLPSLMPGGSRLVDFPCGLTIPLGGHPRSVDAAVGRAFPSG
eukprot:gene4683-biopygen163